MEKTSNSLIHVGSAHSSARRHSTIGTVIRAGCGVVLGISDYLTIVSSEDAIKDRIGRK
jgi:hypothetical protein